MMPGDTEANVTRHIGHFVVSADREAITAYREATRLGPQGDEADDTAVPALFPVTWLGRPDVRAEIETALGGITPDGKSGCLPVQALHRMTFFRKVVPDQDYDMTLKSMKLKQDRFAFGARVRTLEGDDVTQMDIEVLCISLEDGQTK